MDRNSREVAAFVRFGFASLSLERAALCYEASWLPLSTIVPSLRFVPPRLAVVPAVPAVARVRA